VITKKKQQDEGSLSVTPPPSTPTLTVTTFPSLKLAKAILQCHNTPENQLFNKSDLWQYHCHPHLLFYHPSPEDSKYK